MEAGILQLPQKLLLLGTVALTVSTLETADLVERCGRAWQGEGLLLRPHSASRRFYFVAPDTDCSLWVRAAAPGDRIRFQFRFFLVYSLAPASHNTSAPTPAEDACAPGSYLQVYDGPPGAPRALGRPLCGLTIPAPVTSSGPFLGLRLVTRGRQPRVDFVGEVTSFRLGPCGTYFHCQNGRCIPPSLVCDHWGVDNCGDGSDQGTQPPASCRGPSPAPGWPGSTDRDSPEPLTPFPALQSAGPVQSVQEGSAPEGGDPAQGNTALEGSRLHGVVLASLLLLASAGLLAGLLWCCCPPGWLAWHVGGRGVCLRCRASCNPCYQCPGRVAPREQRAHRPAFQDQGGHP
ncbi:low-density lipoprotein receptor class A domain-containing protein 2 [Ctenodactylus gundi]